MSTEPVREIGPYTEGETPRPVTVQFDEDDIDLTGFTLDGVSADVDGTPFVPGATIDWDDQTKGWVTLTITDTETTLPASKTSALVRLQLWASDGANALATLKIVFRVWKAAGTKPTTNP